MGDLGFGFRQGTRKVTTGVPLNHPTQFIRPRARGTSNDRYRPSTKKKELSINLTLTMCPDKIEKISIRLHLLTPYARPSEFSSDQRTISNCRPTPCAFVSNWVVDFRDLLQCGPWRITIECGQVCF